MLILSIASSFFTLDSAAYLPTLIFGTYMGWLYLRYLQRRPETKLRGDPSDDFAFSTFFPELLRWTTFLPFYCTFEFAHKSILASYVVGNFVFQNKMQASNWPHCLNLSPDALWKIKCHQWRPWLFYQWCTIARFWFCWSIQEEVKNYFLFLFLSFLFHFKSSMVV